MSDQTQRLARLFDAVADTYDQVGVDFFGPIAAGLVDELNPQPGERAFDLGCGRGAVLLPVARRVGSRGSVVGADLSSRMVEHCRDLVAADGLSNVEVILLDAQHPDATSLGSPADLVSSSLVVFFLPDPASALAQWRDLLVPGGRLGITTFGEQDPAWSRVDDVFDPYLPPQQLDARTSGASGPFGSDAGVEQLLGDAGFVDLRTMTRRVEVRFDDAGHWYAFSMSVGQRAFWMSVPEGRRSDVRAEASRRIQAAADADGSVTFWQDVRYTLGRRP